MANKKHSGRNPKCDRDWIQKELKKKWRIIRKELKTSWKKIEKKDVQIEKGNRIPKRKGE